MMSRGGFVSSKIMRTQNIAIMMADSKSDLIHLRAISPDDAQMLAEKKGLSVLETSALEALNIENACHTILTKSYHIISKKALAAQETDSKRCWGRPSKEQPST